MKIAPEKWSQKPRETLVWTKDGKPMLRAYASVLKDLFNWLISSGYNLPITSEALALYIDVKAEKSPSGRPRSALKQLKYAFRIYAKALQIEDFFEDESIKRLVANAIQKYTTNPITHVASFHEEMDLLFEYLDRSWIPFEEMEEKELRDRTILLVSMCAMARPSDICAITLLRKRVWFDSHPLREGQTRKDEFVQLTLLGSKTDLHMDGHKVRIYNVDIVKRCPILHLKAYMQATQDKALKFQGDAPLFLAIQTSLHPDIKGLKADSISSIIKTILDLAGIKSAPGKGKISARSIRPTAATQAFINDVSIADILDTGRWSVDSADLLRKHYLRPSRRNNISSALLT